MPIRQEVEDFYVPSLTTRNKKYINKYSLQIIIIVVIFATITLTDASRLKEFLTKLTNLVFSIVKGMFMFVEMIW
jgi:hypothetical protein